MLLLALFELIGLNKEISRQWNSNKRSLFPRLLSAFIELLGLNNEICRHWNLKQSSLFPTATTSTHLTAWATYINKPTEGLETT